MTDDPRYPIGRLKKTEHLTVEQREESLGVLEAAPDRLRAAVRGLSDDQLDTPYREGGWTVRQIVHHLPDSHLNAYVRVRLALTEDEPTVRPYDEKLWAELPDARSGPVEPSLALLEGVHARLVTLLRSVDEPSYARRFVHPEGYTGTIDTLIGMYAWHSKHHTAHVTTLRERMGW
jgi:uncharacterized damage-inducible protein DinB